MTSLLIERSPEDGIFGPGTDAAVKRFQMKQGLTVEGIFDPATRAALDL